MKNNNYNFEARYEIKGRVTTGTSVVAYVIIDRARPESMQILEKAVVEQLALNKQIYNCTAQIYNNIVNLKGIGCKLSQLPRFDMTGKPVVEEVKHKVKTIADLELTGKVQKGRTIRYYIVQPIGNANMRKNLTREQVIELVKAGRIANVKCQMNGNEMILRGASGFNLAQLKTYQV